jgi:hypothetical protein
VDEGKDWESQLVEATSGWDAAPPSASGVEDLWALAEGTSELGAAGRVQSL